MVEIGNPKRQVTIEPFPETAPKEEPRPAAPAPAPTPAPAAPEREPEEVPA